VLPTVECHWDLTLVRTWLILYPPRGKGHGKYRIVSVFFLVVRGENLEVAAWRRIATTHAAALNLSAVSSQWTISNETELLVAVLGHPSSCGKSASTDCFRSGDPEARDFELHVNGVRIGTTTSVMFNTRTANVRVRVPFASPDQAYRWRGPKVSLFTNDLRLAIARQPLSVDRCGVYALLQYGAIPPPFTLFRGVERIPPGHEAALDSTFLTKLPQPSSLPLSSDANETEAALVARIDDVLFRDRRPSAVFFSGGVDSGLLAARIRAAGIRDVPLLNYAFGADDPEAAHAHVMASHLGMPIERIEASTERVAEVLERVAFEYSYPFGDYSSLPTYLLVRGAARWLPPGAEVVDGTGSDGTFALGYAVERVMRKRYQPLSLLPSWAGGLAGRFHAWAGLTTSDGRFASAVRLVHRVTTMPPLFAAVIAQNSLHGECFFAEQDVRDEVSDAVTLMVRQLTQSTSIADRATTLDVVFVCSGIFAAKDFDPLRLRGVDVLYPFLHPDVLAPTLGVPWGIRCAGGQPKALLKRALARHVPPELVFRKKSGFDPPQHQAFTEGEMNEFVRHRALRRESLLAEFLNWDRVQWLFSRAFEGRPLHRTAYNLLWTLSFAGSWLDGLTRVHSRQRD